MSSIEYHWQMRRPEKHPYQVKVYHGAGSYEFSPFFSSYREARKWVTDDFKELRGNLFKVVVDEGLVETHYGSRIGYHHGPSYYIQKNGRTLCS